MNVVVYGDRHAYAVAFSGAEAARKNDLILQVVLFHLVLQKLNDLGRTLQMAGASDA